ncbi:c-type cytochrome [Ensifer canadensis]
MRPSFKAQRSISRGGCAECHGSPGRRRSAEVLAMLPPPPDLKEAVGRWTDEELFVIVRDGLRYTGMPAWPGAGRDGEVWAMVTFLKQLPEMSAARYQELSADGDAGTISAFSPCLSCHRSSPDGGDQAIPAIAGQSEFYLAETLRAYISGKRESGFMEVAASNLSDPDVAAAARHFANLPAQVSATATPFSVRDERALSLVQTGDPVKKIAACDACHDGRNPRYPLLGGQPLSFLSEQLLLFRSDRRGGSATEQLMSRAVRNLTDGDIDRLAAHYASGLMARTLRR